MMNTAGLIRGDVVLVEFLFSDESDSKTRPALVVSAEDYHRSGSEVIIAAITSNVSRRLPGDYVVKDWEFAGLIHPSTVNGILRTVKPARLRRRLGTLRTTDIDCVDRALRRALAL